MSHFSNIPKPTDDEAKQETQKEQKMLKESILKNTELQEELLQKIRHNAAYRLELMQAMTMVVYLAERAGADAAVVTLTEAVGELVTMSAAYRAYDERKAQGEN